MKKAGRMICICLPLSSFSLRKWWILGWGLRSPPCHLNCHTLQGHPTIQQPPAARHVGRTLWFKAEFWGMCLSLWGISWDAPHPGHLPSLTCHSCLTSDFICIQHGHTNLQWDFSLHEKLLLKIAGLNFQTEDRSPKRDCKQSEITNFKDTDEIY